MTLESGTLVRHHNYRNRKPTIPIQQCINLAVWAYKNRNDVRFLHHAAMYPETRNYIPLGAWIVTGVAL